MKQAVGRASGLGEGAAATPNPTPPDDTGSALAEQLRRWVRRWGLVIGTGLIGLAGVIYGAAAKHAAVMCLGFMICALALGCSDDPVDQHNAEVSDALNYRVGYDDREAA
jgi:hypothetical protein